jgi:hypothetical protein
MASEAEIAAGAEERRRLQERRDEAEKTRQFKEMQARNEAKIREQQQVNERLSKAKTAPERIRMRQEAEERLRQENIRTDKINAGWKEPKTPEEREIESNKQKMITTENMKRRAEEIASKAPNYFDRFTTGIFSPVVETATHGYKAPAKNPAVSGLVRETRDFSKVPHAKKPVTGGKVGKTAINQPVSYNQDWGQITNIRINYDLGSQSQYADSLLGINTEKMTGRKIVKPGKLDPLSGLNDFVKRL